MRLAVIGCGIGGMASATQLARDGHDVTVFETFERARPLGAGLLLQPTGLEALSQLGLRDEILARGAEIDGLKGHTPAGRLIMDLRYQFGRKGDIGIGIHRATLFDALYKAMTGEGVTLQTGREVTAITDPETPRLEVGGAVIDGFDAVIVSDGAHSNLRRQICPDARDPVYPWGAVWTIRPDTSGEWHDQRWLAQIYAGTRIMIGVLPAGENPVDPDGPNCVSFFWSLHTSRFDDWREAGFVPFYSDVDRYWPEAASLLDGLGSLESFAAAAYRDVRCPRWHDGKVILIGDAAHGASPQLGQGANMAICDGLALAAELKEQAPARAFVAYTGKRRPVLRYYSWMSWALTPVFQGDSDFLGSLRDLFFGLVCRLPGIRNLMTWTLVGRGRWFW
ncbi:NAD(P)/FAD-dependent oxidoreductase [Hyphobacterium sp. HN65]|uniref:NAD(P)/FAD-dependent oxidoreductase n=1 Tax=Hyphobacterium lacteum TaxID=3116575 RepID=A0ABU7LP34_9PROT|nr:NAD(P)/FAD-dependent oxidoreductase [Hyphobacterium sp. HN65]MEE2525391.1 NAD(P)/FAD-dependent oxidoreductase [Hyphobacterium sp. HN65]